MIQEVLSETRSAMERTIEAAQEDFATVRTGRANPGLYAKVIVEYYGSFTPLQQLASFQVPDARTILINPYDASSIRAIEKALSDSEIGANPSNDGRQIRITMPELTEERRNEYVKLVRTKAEEHKVALRNHRRKGNDMLKELEEDGGVGEDDVKRGENELNQLVRQFGDQIDEMTKNKEAELLEV